MGSVVLVFESVQFDAAISGAVAKAADGQGPNVDLESCRVFGAWHWIKSHAWYAIHRQRNNANAVVQLGRMSTKTLHDGLAHAPSFKPARSTGPVSWHKFSG